MRQRVRHVTLGFALAAGGLACVPEPPPPPPLESTDIFVAALARTDGRLTVGAPDNLTRRPGYDNQPTFLPDGRSFVYTASDGAQTDCHRFDLATRHSEPVVPTVEREYSPRPIPGRKQVSVVRVEADGRQRLWQLDLDGGNPYVLFEWEDRVGYQAWADGSFVVLRVELDPPILRIGNADTGWVEPAPLRLDVGRCLETLPERNAVLYVHKLGEGQWWIEELDLLTRESRRIARTLPGSEDFATLPDGQTLLMAQGSRLYAWSGEGATSWTEIADLGPAGLRHITRLAVSPSGDALLLVAESPDS